MNVCPNCGQPVENGKELCPNCGASVSSIWPPPPVGLGKATGKKHARQFWGADIGVVLGCGLSLVLYYFLGVIAFVAHNEISARMIARPWYFRYGTWTINLVPLLLIGGLFLFLRPAYPGWSRGFGYVLLVIAALLLYGLVACRQ